MIHFYNQDSNYNLLNRLKIRRWIAEVIRREGYSLGEINYIFCSSEYHRQMNRDFLGHDYYTDVITFEERETRKMGVINGEVYIDVATVEDNAEILALANKYKVKYILIDDRYEINIEL